MNYSNDPWNVRADFFKQGGKWYATDVLDMADLYYGTCGELNGRGRGCLAAPHNPGHHLLDALVIAWVNLARYQEFVMVVLEPYHEHAHPMALRLAGGTGVPAWRDL